MWKKWKTYLISVIIALLVGALSAVLTGGNMNLYAEIRRPPLSPPAFLFPVVWTVLFALMGIGSACVFLARREKPREATDALVLYAVNLIANVTWSILFFNLRAFWFSFVWILFLLFIIYRMIRAFLRVCPVGGYLQIPYFVWVSFATYLTLAIAILN